MDLLLTVIICISQFLLGFLGIYVAIRPPNREHHKQWIIAFVLFGVVGIIATGWLAKRSSDVQEQTNAELHKALLAATDANTAATNANNAATAAQNAATSAERETTDARREATSATHSLLGLINRRSKETTTAILNLGTETQLSIKAISTGPPPRRIPAENREQLLRFFAEKRSKVRISAISNDAEAYRFAQDWYEVLKAAGWTIEGERIETFLAGGPPQFGLVISFHGEPSKPGQSLQVPNSEPAGYIVRVANALKVTISGQTLPDVAEGSVVMNFYSRPPTQ